MSSNVQKMMGFTLSVTTDEMPKIARPFFRTGYALFVSQSLDRVKLCRTVCRVIAEEHAYCH